MSSGDQGEPGYRYAYERLTRRWAILVSLPVGYKRRDYSVAPHTFATEAEARAAATSEYGSFLARINYPWRITEVVEPFPPYWPDEPEVDACPADAAGAAAIALARQNRAGVPHDLSVVHDNLVSMIVAQCRDLASTANPVMLTFIDICALQDPSSFLGVPADIARALWMEGLQALRDIQDAALDPSRQIDAVSRLGLRPGSCPSLAVLVYQSWLVHEYSGGRLHKRQSYEPRTDVPRFLHVEIRAHGSNPVVANWDVLQRGETLTVVPVAPRPSVGAGKRSAQ